jgi:predicted nucleic acid-binding protein
MTLADIPAGETVFIDANIFILSFRPDPVLGTACEAFLRRVENGDVRALTSSHVLSEMAHRMMTDEAAQRFGWSMAGIAGRLRKNPIRVQALSRYRQAIDEIALLGVQILPVAGPQVSRGADVCRQYGLLSSDAQVVTVMNDHGLTHLASHDSDFDRVPGITRYGPV